MIETLNNMQPGLIFFSLAFFFVLETFIPNLAEQRERRKHTLRNLTLALIIFLVNGGIASWLTYWMWLIHERGWGLLNAVPINAGLATVFGILLIDLDSYAGHVLYHKVPWMWRMHRVHHSDPELDSTSSLRFHPLEALTQAGWRTASFALLGIPFSSFVVLYTLLLPLLFLQHANIRFPRWLDSYPGAIFVMSGWHKVHHSDEQRYTDSHYGNLFTFWDRLFGTARPEVHVDRLSWGLKEFRQEKDQTVKSQLLLPFRRLQ